jgi:dihydroflavonol-4-reductase
MILVTGGTGFVGRRLVEALATGGSAVRVLTRSPAHANAVHERVTFVEANLLEPSSLPSAVQGVATIVHLAASLPGSAGATHLAEINVDGTRNLARAACASAVSGFIHISSAGVYGDGDIEAPRTERDPVCAATAYERSKLASETAVLRELEGSATHWVILRPAGIHGPGRTATLTFLREVQRKTIWVHGSSRVIVHPTHVDDVVGAIRLVLARDDLDGEVFNIGGERPLPFAEFIELVARSLNRHLVQLRLPAAAGRGAAAIERAARGLGMQPPARLSRLARVLINRAVDTSKARRMLGLEPVPLEAGIGATVQWFRQEQLL